MESGVYRAAAVGSASIRDEMEEARADSIVHLQDDGGEQAKHGDQAQCLDHCQPLRVRAEAEEGNLEGMTGFRSRGRTIACAAFVLARAVMKQAPVVAARRCQAVEAPPGVCAPCPVCLHSAPIWA